MFSNIIFHFPNNTFNRRKFIWIQLIVQENLFNSNAEVNDAIKDSESKLCISKMTKIPIIWKHPQILVVQNLFIPCLCIRDGGNSSPSLSCWMLSFGFEWIVKGVWPRKSPVPYNVMFQQLFDCWVNKS